MLFSQLKSGKSVEGAEIPVFWTEKKEKEYIYLMAGIHGDEVEGVYLLKKIFEWLHEDSYLELPLIVIPILNVDGYRMSTRTNSHGVDLNRNFPSKNWKGTTSNKKYNPGESPLSEPENVFLINLLNKFQPKFFLSFHSWKPFINYDGGGEQISQFLSELNGYEVIPELDKDYHGTLGQYLPEKHNSPVITFECPRVNADKSLESIWHENEKAFKELFYSNLIK